jgi:hypothetical protein
MEMMRSFNSVPTGTRCGSLDEMLFKQRMPSLIDHRVVIMTLVLSGYLMLSNSDQTIAPRQNPIPEAANTIQK